MDIYLRSKTIFKGNRDKTYVYNPAGSVWLFDLSKWGKHFTISILVFLTVSFYLLKTTQIVLSILLCYLFFVIDAPPLLVIFKHDESWWSFWFEVLKMEKWMFFFRLSF